MRRAQARQVRGVCIVYEADINAYAQDESEKLKYASQALIKVCVNQHFTSETAPRVKHMLPSAKTSMRIANIT